MSKDIVFLESLIPNPYPEHYPPKEKMFRIVTNISYFLKKNYLYRAHRIFSRALKL